MIFFMAGKSRSLNANSQKRFILPGDHKEIPGSENSTDVLNLGHFCPIFLAIKLHLNLCGIYKKIWYNSLLEEKKMKFRCKFVFIFILLGFLFQSGCELFKARDIEGIWTITILVNGETTSYTAEFVGTRESGNVYAEEVGVWYGGGTYNVKFDTELSFYVTYFDIGATTTTKMDVFTGGFDTKDTMSGTLEARDEGVTKYGEWSAVRQEETF